MSPKNIFTFFDNKISPAYLNLCLQTWLINAGDEYQINILNYENLHKYVPSCVLENIKKQTSSVLYPIFIDYIASVVLYHNGGVFLDADTILTEKFNFQDVLLKNSDLIVFSKGLSKVCSGFMLANRGASVLGELIKKYESVLFSSVLQGKKRNSFISDIASDFGINDIFRLDCEKNGYYMEQKLFGVVSDYIYQKYYFTNICSVDEFFENTDGIVALHNSKTPEYYKKMNEKEFLAQDILLAKILKKIITA